MKNLRVSRFLAVGSMILSVQILLPCLGFSQNAGSVSIDRVIANEILPHYLKIQESLAADTLVGVAQDAQAIIKKSKKLEEASGTTGSKSDARAKRRRTRRIRTVATLLTTDKDLSSARRHFKKLSAFMIAWASNYKVKEVERVTCPMAKADWLQRKGQIRNPYYGKEMLECGEAVKD